MKKHSFNRLRKRMEKPKARRISFWTATLVCAISAIWILIWSANGYLFKKAQLRIFGTA